MAVSVLLREIDGEASGCLCVTEGDRRVAVSVLLRKRDGETRAVVMYKHVNVQRPLTYTVNKEHGGVCLCVCESVGV